MDIINNLFVDWDLDTWANVLEVVGFVIATISLIVSFFIKSELNDLKTSFLLGKRINKHIENVASSATKICDCLDDYNKNTDAIRAEFSVCISELEDILTKLGYRQGAKSRRLIKFLKVRREKPFAVYIQSSHPIVVFFTKRATRFYQTTYNDVWLVYNRLIEIQRQLENIKENKNKSLKK